MTLDSSDRILDIGTDVGGYRVTHVLGQGGFGVTYAAETVFGEKVALKQFLFRSALASSVAPEEIAEAEKIRDWALKSFRKTVFELKKLDHPNIVKVLHFIPGEKTGFLVMELVEGVSLDRMLRERGAMRADELKPYILPVLDALDYVHAQNRIHRDIAPDNIMVRADGTPVLIDFGSVKQIVREVDHAETEAGLTRISHALSYPVVKRFYSPPEQYQYGADLTPAADVYSVAAVIYRALTGRPPADAQARLHGAAMQGGDAYEPAELIGIGPALDRALALRVDRRTRTVAALRRDLGWAREAPRPSTGENDEAADDTAPPRDPLCDVRIDDPDWPPEVYARLAVLDQKLEAGTERNTGEVPPILVEYRRRLHARAMRAQETVPVVAAPTLPLTRPVPADDGWVEMGRPGGAALPPPWASPAPAPQRPRRWTGFVAAALLVLFGAGSMIFGVKREREQTADLALFERIAGDPVKAGEYLERCTACLKREEAEKLYKAAAEQEAAILSGSPVPYRGAKDYLARCRLCLSKTIAEETVRTAEAEDLAQFQAVAGDPLKAKDYADRCAVCAKRDEAQGLYRAAVAQEEAILGEKPNDPDAARRYLATCRVCTLRAVAEKTVADRVPASTVAPAPRRPVLGLDLSALSEEARLRYKIKRDVKGVLIVSVLSDTFAAGRNLRPGDVIVEIGQQPVSTPADVTRRIEEHKAQNLRSVLLLVANPDGGVRFVALPL